MPETPASEHLSEWISEFNEEALTANGFDAAIIGIAERCGQPFLVVYDAEKCVQILAERGMTYEEAHEFFSFNVSGAWMGENTPLWLWRKPELPALFDLCPHCGLPRNINCPCLPEEEE